MNRTKAAKWLQRAVEFSRAPDMRAYGLLIGAAAQSGIYCNTSKPDHDEQIAYSARSVAKALKNMIDHKEAMVRPLRTVFHYTAEPLDDDDPLLQRNSPEIATIYHDDHSSDYDASLAAAMMQIMAQAGIRSVGICQAQGCSNITFSRQSKPKETCGNRCRQKVFRDRLSDEEKKEIYDDRVRRRREQKEAAQQKKKGV